MRTIIELSISIGADVADTGAACRPGLELRCSEDGPVIRDCAQKSVPACVVGVHSWNSPDIDHREIVPVIKRGTTPFAMDAAQREISGIHGIRIELREARRSAGWPFGRG